MPNHLPLYVSLIILATLLVACAAFKPPTTPTLTPTELTRGEVAPLIVSLYTAGTGKVPPVVLCPFKDIGDLPKYQRDAICQLWGLKITIGTVRDEFYSPDMPFGLSASDYLSNLASAIERDRQQ